LVTAVETEIKSLNESVENAINDAVTNATKDLPTTVSNAVADALKNYVKADDIKNFVTADALKDLATNQSVTELESELETVKESIANGVKPAMRNKSNTEKPNNRFDVDGIGFVNGPVSTAE
jgi:outer membrane PBP1 activator LpoA protein